LYGDDAIVGTPELLVSKTISVKGRKNEYGGLVIFEIYVLFYGDKS